MTKDDHESYDNKMDGSGCPKTRISHRRLLRHGMGGTVIPPQYELLSRGRPAKLAEYTYPARVDKFGVCGTGSCDIFPEMLMHFYRGRHSTISEH